MPTTEDYVALVTPEHDDKPRFVAAVALHAGGMVDAAAVALALPGAHDLDVALGQQLDSVGRWVGLTRFQDVPSLGRVELADADYRILLRAKVLANHWDGGMESLQAILAALFPGTGIVLFAVDYQDMSMDIYITGGTPTALQIALIKGGLLVPKPEGVRINGIVLASAGPQFGIDRDDSFVSGFDTGRFATYL